MRLVYIAGPISKGDMAHNVNQGTAAFLALAKAGIASICPMWSVFSGQVMRADGIYPQMVHVGNRTIPMSSQVFAVAAAAPNELTHADWLNVDFELIRRCDAVLRLPGESVGADAEVAEANRLSLPVLRSVDGVIRWATADRRTGRIIPPQGGSGTAPPCVPLVGAVVPPQTASLPRGLPSPVIA